METKYFIAVGGQQQGPYTIDELRSMEIYADTLVWKSGMPDWQPASAVEELSGIVRTPSTPPQPEPPLPMSGGAAPVKRSFLRRHRGWFIALGILIVLCGVMALTNPDRKAHTDAINKMLSDNIKTEMTKVYGGEYADQAISTITSLAEKHSGHFIKVHNYGLFSVGEMEIDGKSSNVSVGLFGHVFTISSAVEEYMKKQSPMNKLETVKQEVSTAVDTALHQVVNEAEELLSSIDSMDVEKLLGDALTEIKKAGSSLSNNSGSDEAPEDGEHPVIDPVE